MLLPNPEVDEAGVLACLRAQYDGTVTALVFVPEGGDSWCYRAGSWWVSARRDRQGHFPAAYETAAALAESGAEFVLPPARGANGQVVHRVGQFPVVVSRYVEGEVLFDDGPVGTDEEQRALVRIVQHLHAVHDGGWSIPREDFSFPWWAELTGSVELAASQDVAAGPYSRRVHDLVTRNRPLLERWMVEAHEVAVRCRDGVGDGDMVLTHGEPNGGNVLRRRDGALLLLDWGDLAWGPPERDWFAVRSHYRNALNASRIDPDPARLRFYELRWVLGEVAEYVDRFTTPHSGGIDDRDKWSELVLYLPEG